MLLLKQHTGLNSMLILSMAGHILAIVSILYYESVSRERLVRVPPVYTVKLVTSKPARKRSVPRKRIMPKSMASPDRSSVKKAPEKPDVRHKEKTAKLLSAPSLKTKDPLPMIELPVVQPKKPRRSSNSLQTAIKSREMKIKAAENERAIHSLFSNLRSKSRNEPTPVRPRKEAVKSIADTQPAAGKRSAIDTTIERMKIEDTLRSEDSDIKKAFKSVDKEKAFDDDISLPDERRVALTVEKNVPSVEDRVKMLSDRQEGIRVMDERILKIRKAFSDIKSSESRRSVRRERTVKEGKKVTVSYKAPAPLSPVSGRIDNMTAAVTRVASGKGAMTERVAREVALTIQNIIRSRVEAAWELDEYLARRGDYVSLKSILLLKVAPDGRITGTTVLKASDNRVFHESVLKAVKESDPLLIGRFNLAESFEVELVFSPRYR